MGKKDKHTDSEGSDSDDSKKGRKEKKHDKKDKDKDKDKDKKHKAHDDVHSGYPGLSSPYVAPQHPPGPQTHTHGQSPPIVDPHVYGQLGGQQHQQIPVHSPPPATVHANVNAPPSGFRLPLSTTSPFPPPDQCGPPPTFDLDGSPVYVGSALLQNAVHPCKIAPRHSPPCLVPYAGTEVRHNGRYDLLPFTPDMMQWVPTSHGRVPPGRRPVEGGYEEHGPKLYHGLAVVGGVRVPGKCAEHLNGCNVGYGGAECSVQGNHEILCWVD